MNRRRFFRTVVLSAVVLGLLAGLNVLESSAALTGQGWVNMRSIDPRVYSGAWGYYSYTSSKWLSKYYDTRFYYYSSKYYDFFVPVYTKSTASAPWALYTTGLNLLKYQAYWLASKPLGDDAMSDAINKVTRCYQGRIRVFLAYGSDVGTGALGLFTLSWDKNRVINASSITLNTEDLKGKWTPSTYNVNFVAWMGAILCHETSHQQWALTTRYVRIWGLNRQLDAYEMALDEGLAHYAGAMAYRYVPQAIASGIEGYFATSYDDLREKMVKADGDWYNWASVGYRYSPLGVSTDKDRWQLVAIGYYLTQWKVGQSGWYAGKAVNMFLNRTAVEIGARGTSFTWINSVQPVFGFTSMSAIQFYPPNSYRHTWNIEKFRFKSIIPD